MKYNLFRVYIYFGYICAIGVTFLLVYWEPVVTKHIIRKSILFKRIYRIYLRKIF